jgi:hypothetical protein
MGFKQFYLLEGILSKFNLPEIKTISQSDWDNNEGYPIISTLKDDLGHIPYDRFKELIRKEEMEQDADSNSEEMNLNDPMKNTDVNSDGGGGGETNHDIS